MGSLPSEECLTSLELHLRYPAGAVVKVSECEDVACGIYPTYVFPREDSVLVSTSASELVRQFESVELNSEFDPPRYTLETSTDEPSNGWLDDIPQPALSMMPTLIGEWLDAAGVLPEPEPWYANLWYDGWNTIDSRIRRLQPFERITPARQEIDFRPTFDLSGKSALISEVAHWLQQGINRVERRFPGYHHLIMMGGRDSQLIGLVPKVTDNWHVFSAAPNYGLVREFLNRNDVTVDRLFHHDNSPDETEADLRRKIVCSDLYADPRHIRWRVALEQVVNQFENKCIIWAGTEADTFLSYTPEFHDRPREEYFDQHLTRAVRWQGTTHQTTKNFTGAPMLSPYHLPDIWTEVFTRYDPDVLVPGDDFRPAVAERLLGEPAWFPDTNPGPPPYSYDYAIDPFAVYREYVSSLAAGQEPSLINDRTSSG